MQSMSLCDIMYRYRNRARAHNPSRDVQRVYLTTTKTYLTIGGTRGRMGHSGQFGG